MIKSLFAVAARAGARAAGGPKSEAASTEAAGPAVSPSEAPRNAAIDMTPTTGETTQTPGASSFTEGQARSAIESAGYTGVEPLTQTPEGLWQGRATKDGKAVMVSVDYKGAVSPV